MASYKYLYTMEATGQLDIEDRGNCCISAVDNLYRESILVVKTDLGFTKIIQWGPMVVDSDLPCAKMSCTYQHFDYDEYKIDKIIDKFLNGTTLCSQAQEIPLEEGISKMKDLVTFL